MTPRPNIIKRPSHNHRHITTTTTSPFRLKTWMMAYTTTAAALSIGSRDRIFALSYAVDSTTPIRSSSTTMNTRSSTGFHHHHRRGFFTGCSTSRTVSSSDWNKWNSILTCRAGSSGTDIDSSISATATATADDDGSATTAAAVDNVPQCAKLTALRHKMADLNLDAYVVPSDDPHLSEYPAECFKRREFLTGFSGSAGTAVVTREKAYLWTDSRYFNQASLELDSNNWTLMKQAQPSVPTIPQFLSRNASHKSSQTKTPFRVGIDPFVHSASFAQSITNEFAIDDEPSHDNDASSSTTTNIGEIDTLDEEGNLIDSIWGTDRPPVPTAPFRIHPLEYAGTTVSHKLKSVAQQMLDRGASLAVFSTLDDVAYLLNLRAYGDIECSPVGIAYATVELDDESDEPGGTKTTLFCDDGKVASSDVTQHLHEAGVAVRPYSDVLPFLRDYLDTTTTGDVWLDGTRSNYALHRIIPTIRLLDEMNPLTLMKACKNKREMEGMRLAHQRDGAAAAHFFAWLEHAVLVEKRKVSELEIDEVFTRFRSDQKGFNECSFPTIAGVGPNGAIIHYRAENNDLLRYLDNTQPLLLDSGGLYDCGTTDVTRTVHLGSATLSFREDYTRVLKGNIALDQMVFPEGTPGFVLDVMARKYLWGVGKDYGHGTGHGVGAALNCHEGPMSISPRWGNTEGLKKGMIVSNEPGYYEDNVCGIRIENLLEITYVDESANDAYDDGEPLPKLPPGQKRFLRFKPLTMIPIQKNLIDINLMTEEELDWIDGYHKEVFEIVAQCLEEGTPEYAWLKKACEVIDR